jgi:predicted O-methyltransferase YrrM
VRDLGGVKARQTTRRALLAAVRRSARALGYDLVRSGPYDLVPRTVYSPVPDVPASDVDVWAQPASLVGVDLEAAKSFELLETELAPFLKEFEPPADQGAEPEFYLWNGYYQSVDAEVLYAMIRRLKPRRVLEIGSGYSTLVTAEACERNAADGHPAEFVAVDPEPRIPSGPSGLTQREHVRAQDLPLERFLALDRDDVLFIDSSHTVKVGSDVNFLVLEVLPRLRPGVVVHIHDIFLPFEYPRTWYERGTFLTEQYLVHAFLIWNAGYEILFAAHAALRDDRARLEATIPSLRVPREHYPGALWLIRTGQGLSPPWGSLIQS